MFIIARYQIKHKFYIIREVEESASGVPGCSTAPEITDIPRILSDATFMVRRERGLQKCADADEEVSRADAHFAARLARES